MYHWNKFSDITCAISIPLYSSGCNTHEFRVAAAVFNREEMLGLWSRPPASFENHFYLKVYWMPSVLQAGASIHYGGMENSIFTKSGILVAF